MSKSRTPSARSSDSPDAAPKPGHRHHPVGLLYTLLRHGRGLTHEEAGLRSTESIDGPPVNSPSVNSTAADSPPADGPPKAA